jgi:ABC-2 type transport system ATP-binding protein
VSDRAQPTVQVLSAPEYPGLRGTEEVPVPAPAMPTPVLAPAGGEPRSISSLPGLGALAALAQGLAGDRFGPQSIRFASDPLPSGIRSVGSMRVELDITADRAVRDGVLFASLQVLSGDRPITPAGLVAPVLLPPLGAEPVRIAVDLPVVVTDIAAGDRIAVAIGTTDLGYRIPDGPAVYTIDLVGDSLAVPTVPMTATSTGVPVWVWPPATIAFLLLIWLLLRWWRPRRRGEPRADLVDVPLAIHGLHKGFRNGVKAVDDVSFQVPRGIVLGLLGPNGAGKTTTMRMVTGLIRPSAGTVHVFGEPVQAGAAPLARIGAFIEGPGFLPHLTGRQNLDLFWRASGREDGDPQLDMVLDIAGLGPAIDRRVRTYSQGMRQRLGIAQAMLGMPEILLLDEPTNGLDPPQIREMRQVIANYAATGRTVIVSSHLLAEVEQTCTDVVVMHRGRLIAQGRVDELLAGRTGQRLEDVFMEIVGDGHMVVSGS